MDDTDNDHLVYIHCCDSWVYTMVYYRMNHILLVWYRISHILVCHNEEVLEECCP